MSSNYQLSIRLNSIFNFPVTPEEIKVSYGSNNSNRVCTESENARSYRIVMLLISPSQGSSLKCTLAVAITGIFRTRIRGRRSSGYEEHEEAGAFHLTGECGCLCMPQSRNLQPRKSAGIPERYIMTSLSRSTGKLPCGR